jgi:dienelactone hydrolase
MNATTSAATGLLPPPGRATESHPGLVTEYGTLVTRDRTRLRTILTRPERSMGKLPAIQFVQWLSCDTIELPASPADGWGRMMARLARESGMVMMRTEKRGVGDSEGGPCAELDYLTELSDHRDALAWLSRSEHVDPERIIVFGASIGATYAPLVADGMPVAGVMAWGGGASTWFERMVRFERNRRELTGVSGDRLGVEMKAVTEFLFRYLVERRTPDAIRKADAKLGAIWAQITGTEGITHYGRPVAFHHQAQDQDWAAAWSRLRVPALVLHGEYDWYEELAAAALIERIVRRDGQGRARLRVIPKTDHHFMRFDRPEDAAGSATGTTNEGPAVDEMLSWLKETLKR